MRCALLSCLLLLPVAASAQARGEAPPPASSTENIRIVDMQAVAAAVSPGPGLWKVSKGGNVLWILGTVSPMPRRLDWETHRVGKVIAGAQEVLMPPGIEVTPKIGVLRGLYLGPSLLKARRNPGDALLRDQVTAGQYERWSVLKARYLGNDSGVERYRPIFAAGELYKEAIEDSGLTYDNPAQAAIERLARKHGVRVTPTKLQVEVRNQRDALRQFAQATLDDGECFARTLERIEVELGEMRARANAWADGDLEALRRLPPLSAQYEACSNALTGSAIARRLGLGDVHARARAQWLGYAERALDRNRVTFAVLPLSELVKADGALARLRGMGYAVAAPDAQGDAATQVARLP